MNRRLERRNFYRQPMDAPVQFLEVQAEGFRHSRSVDLSFGGLSFITDHRLPAGTNLDIRLPVDDSGLGFQGRVAYCFRVEGTQSYRVGVAFRDEGSSLRARLAIQMQRIRNFQKELRSSRGADVSEDEAALLWISKYAESFAKKF